MYHFGGGNQSCSRVHRSLSDFQRLHKKDEESVAERTVD